MQVQGLKNIKKELKIGYDNYMKLRQTNPEFNACFDNNEKHLCLNIEKAKQILNQIRNKEIQDNILPDVLNQSQTTIDFVIEYYGHTTTLEELNTFMEMPRPIDYNGLTDDIKSLWWKCKQHQITHNEKHPIEKLNLWSEQTETHLQIPYTDIITVFFNDLKGHLVNDNYFQIPRWRYENNVYIRESQ